jgi:hypothetical protein
MMMIIRVDDEDKNILVNLRSKNLKFDLFFRILLNENFHSSTEKVVQWGKFCSRSENFQPIWKT